jgi:hypothetical protein
MTAQAQSKVWTRDDVIELLDGSKAAVVRALKAIYARQTSDEQSAGTTKHSNGRGFNGTDAEFLSSVAAALPRWNDNITPRQLAKVRPMLKKYWKQLLEEIEIKGGAVDYRAHLRKSAKAEKPESVKAPKATPSSGIEYGMF